MIFMNLDVNWHLENVKKLHIILSMNSDCIVFTGYGFMFILHAFGEKRQDAKVCAGEQK